MTTTQKRLTLQPPDAATGGGRCRDAWNGVTERSHQLRHCQTERTGDAAFNMKQTVDAFFDSASQKHCQKYSQKPFQRVLTRHWKPPAGMAAETPRGHSGIACRGTGAPDITREIQQDIARRMRTGHEMPGADCPADMGAECGRRDLGTWGDLWPVKEPDMLRVICSA